MLSRALSKRRARILAGQVGVAWFVVVLLMGLATLLGLGEGLATFALLLGAPAIAGSYLMARLLTRARPREPGLTLSSLRRAQALEHDSLAWPMAAGVLFGPLTVHLWLWGVFGCLLGTGKLADFDSWLAMSSILTLAAHVVLLGRGVLHARTLSEVRFGAQPKRVAPLIKTIGAVALAGLVPGVVLLGIPPIIVVLTAILVVPVVFQGIRAAFTAERADLLEAALSDDLDRPGVLRRQAREVLHTRSLPDSMQHHALGVLAATSSRDDLSQDLMRFFEGQPELPRGSGGDVRTVSTALELCNEFGLQPPLQASLRMAKHLSHDVALPAIRFLRNTADPSAQAVLRRLLARHDMMIQIEAARALGGIGTRVAVGELGALAGRTSNPRVRSAARGAIDAIRSRIGGADHAALSFPVEEDKAGALSPAVMRQEGALSDVDPWRGPAALAEAPTVRQAGPDRSRRRPPVRFQRPSSHSLRLARRGPPRSRGARRRGSGSRRAPPLRLLRRRR